MKKLLAPLVAALAVATTAVLGAADATAQDKLKVGFIFNGKLRRSNTLLQTFI